ncbi:MAG: 50S ribosomal protein L23, partial [Acidobacteriota bacterium]|nr:50S ribosomal protein L23 [Acidobacteriota bacterium]
MVELGVWDILKSPVVTEKSVLLKEATSEDENLGQILTFRVARTADKNDIKRAVEEIFTVKVSRV